MTEGSDNMCRSDWFFCYGRNEAMRISQELEIDSGEALMRREDDRIFVEPIRGLNLLATLSMPSSLEEALPEAGGGYTNPVYASDQTGTAWVHPYPSICYVFIDRLRSGRLS